MDLEMLWKIDRQYVGQIEEAKKEFRVQFILLHTEGLGSPDNDDWVRSFDKLDRLVDDHKAWIKSIFR